MWIVLLIFITVLLFLLYMHIVLKKQACKIYKYWSYYRNLRVMWFDTFFEEITEMKIFLRFTHIYLQLVQAITFDRENGTTLYYFCDRGVNYIDRGVRSFLKWGGK